MIGRLRGTLLEKKAPLLLIDVGGVGYEVHAPMTTFYELPNVGEEVVLHTHFMVREDAHLLFGFISETDRALFRSLIKVTGVGGKMALTLLSGMSADQFVSCIHNNETTQLTRVPGVGKKTAERLIVEMRDRLKDWQHGGGVFPNEHQQPIASQVHDNLKDAISALVSLGFKPPEASRMVSGIDTSDMASEEIIRRALQSVSS